MSAVEDREALIALKEGIYSFLSSVFNSSPQEKHISLLNDEDIIDVLHQLSPESVPYLKPPARVDLIRQDFNDLFMVPGEKYVTPYESVYVDENRADGLPGKKLLMGPSAVDVKKFYKKAGFKLSQKNIELPDFAGTEIEFVATLLREERAYLENDKLEEAYSLDKSRMEFLKLHLGRWIEQLCDRIFKNAESDFYKGIALLAKRFVLQDINN